MTIVRSLVAGTIAGATATMALDISTYADMAARGRAPSDLPATVVAKLAERLGLEAGGDDDPAKNRRSAVGSLLGYANGLGVGAAYGIVRPLVRRAPPLVVALALGAATMALSDVPATRLGATDPRSWSITDWLSDIVPHAVFGATLVLAYAAFDDARDSA